MLSNDKTLQAHLPHTNEKQKKKKLYFTQIDEYKSTVKQNNCVSKIYR